MKSMVYSLGEAIARIGRFYPDKSESWAGEGIQRAFNNSDFEALNPTVLTFILATEFGIGLLKHCPYCEATVGGRLGIEINCPNCGCQWIIEHSTDAKS